MEGATFILKHVGVTNRFRFFLQDENDKTILTGQIREVKPMCLDEIKWIRKVAIKDSFYERVKKEEGYVYILRANDAHELGRGNIHLTEELMNEEIELVKQYAVDADVVDETPEEERVRARDFVVEESSKLLEEMGLEYS
jgi:uncharacterized protein YegP (UPF0339 family)